MSKLIQQVESEQLTSDIPDFGAGDTVVAALAIGIVSGFEWKEILFFANIAAGIVIKKLGTSVVTLSEVLSIIDQDNQ